MAGRIISRGAARWRVAHIFAARTLCATHASPPIIITALGYRRRMVLARRSVVAGISNRRCEQRRDAWWMNRCIGAIALLSTCDVMHLNQDLGWWTVLDAVVMEYR